MKTRRRLLRSLVLMVGSVRALTLCAQTPLGKEFVPASTAIDASLQFGAAPACNSASVCALFWLSAKPNGEVNNDRSWARTLSPLGVLSDIVQLRHDDGASEQPNVVPLAHGFAIFDSKALPHNSFGPFFRVYNDRLAPRTPFIQLPFHEPPIYGDPDSFAGFYAAARSSQGFVVTSEGYDTPPTGPENPFGGRGLFLYFVDSQGRKLRDSVRVNEDPAGDQISNRGALAVDGRGNIIVTYWQNRTLPEDWDVYVRRFSPQGEPLGPEVRVNTFLGGNQWYSNLAASPDGEFLVAWQSDGQDGSLDGIYARRFGADGEPLGPEFRVNEITISEQRDPQVSSDSHGNYFVAWDSFIPIDGLLDGAELEGRLFHHDGTPVAGEIHINQARDNDQVGGLSAFAPNGTLLVSWQSESFEQARGEAHVPSVRRYAASPGPESCLVSGPRIRCDLGRTGGPAELRLSWGGRPGETTLFGDVDRDGRDDVCSYYRQKLRCDLAHDGTPKPAMAGNFGSPGDAPLLGDVDGDGRADLCLRRRDLLICDTAHAGGEGNLRFPFGRGGETPMLGDLDGDGRADLCLFEAGEWDCRLARSGGTQPFRFGQRGDAPALGDIDRDGRAEACVLRAGQLLCDTGHDGGEAEYHLPLEPLPGARLLFGNLDGL